MLWGALKLGSDIESIACLMLKSSLKDQIQLSLHTNYHLKYIKLYTNTYRNIEYRSTGWGIESSLVKKHIKFQHTNIVSLTRT